MSIFQHLFYNSRVLSQSSFDQIYTGTFICVPVVVYTYLLQNFYILLQKFSYESDPSLDC